MIVNWSASFIIPLLCHFTILGQWIMQDMPWYYTVKQSKNTEGKWSNKMASGNDFNCVIFPLFFGFAFLTTNFYKFFCWLWKPLNYLIAIVFIFGACPIQSVRSSDEAIWCISKTRRQKLKVSRVINLLPDGLTYETLFFLVAGIFLTPTGSGKCNTTSKISPTIIKIMFSAIK